MSISICVRKHFVCELWLKNYIYNNRKCSKCPPWNSTHASTRLVMVCHINSKIPAKMRIVWQASTMRWWSASSLSSEAACHKVLGAPTGKSPKDSNLASLEAVQWVLLYLSVSLTGVIDNMSHSTAETCLRIVMNIPHSCFDCQCYIFQ
jgi:hypothetical protein